MVRLSIATAALMFASLVSSHAAEIRVISANGMREVIAETKSKFEQTSKNTLTVTVVETGEIRRRVMGGERFDVIIVPRPVSEELAKADKLDPATAVELIRVNFGLAVATDSPKPDVSTPEALKQTLLAARHVLITDPATGGISGVHAMEVINKLGIADEMKDKLIPNPGGGFHATRVVQGEADLAIQTEHEIRCVKGATYLPFPVQFQRTIVFQGAIGTTATDAAAAKAYLQFLTGSEVLTSIKAHCLSPG